VDWVQTGLIAVVVPVVTAAALIYQQRRHDSGDAERRKEEREERRLDREHALALQREAYARSVEEHWRAERREAYAAHIEVINRVFSAVLSYKIDVEAMDPEEPCPQQVGGLIDYELSLSFDSSTARTELVATEATREILRRITSAVQDMDSAPLGIQTAGGFLATYGAFMGYRRTFADMARADIGTGERGPDQRP
jgi:hypothetical protein